MRTLLTLAAVATLFVLGGRAMGFARVAAAGGGAPAATAEATYHRITPEEAKAIMDGDEAYVLLDVRTEDEYAQQRIDGAMLIPGDEIARRAEAELADKGALILVYCRSGRRSAAAANALARLGYTNVQDFGGILDWPYATVRG